MRKLVKQPHSASYFDLQTLTFHLEYSHLQCEKTATVAGDEVDNDCDGRIDEEIRNKKDDDGDGKVDEDLALVKTHLFHLL